ncbi:MAG: serine/threonine-protein kinase [Byssovorax sp.]
MSTQTNAPLREGEVFAGKYLLEGMIGCGGMGMVLAAKHLTLDAPRAIKVLLSAELDDGSEATRLLDEARILARLGSEHVVRVFDSGRLDSGAPYVVLERLDGLDLCKHLERRKRISIGDAARCLIQVCDAMAEAHALGIVHLDLKPANLFLTTRSDGSICVKVLDFGVAQILEPGSPRSAKALPGTPSYMAPEQLIASPEVGPRTDIWALGVILLELVTGTLPFEADTLTATLLRVIKAEPTLPAELPSDVAAIVRRCLEKSPSRRFQSVLELRAALSSLALGAEECLSAATPDTRLDHPGSSAPADTLPLGPGDRRWADTTRDLGANAEEQLPGPATRTVKQPRSATVWASLGALAWTLESAPDPVHLLVSFGIVTLRCCVAAQTLSC